MDFTNSEGELRIVSSCPLHFGTWMRLDCVGEALLLTVIAVKALVSFLLGTTGGELSSGVGCHGTDLCASRAFIDGDCVVKKNSTYSRLFYSSRGFTRLGFGEKTVVKFCMVV